ncbi:MAG: replicative DNA helicase, partial [Clostridiales Family XIII bacterium]|nr:replicative DNA helicase [Clostridiales Family XIII bacterium]
MEGRVPPYSEEAERSVLGAALQSKQALYDIMESLQKEDFYHGANGEIFDAMSKLYRRGEEADILTVAEILKKNKRLEASGGEGYLGELVNSVPSPSSAAQYAKIVTEKAILRRLIEESGEIISKSYEDREDAIDVLDDAEKRILDIGQSRQSKDFIPIATALEKTLKKMEEMKDAPSGITGLATGFADLDKKTSGLQNS